jgi:hypothetical protein
MTALSGKPTFGAGRVFATLNVTTPTPARAFVPQSQSLDFKRKVESLFGDRQLPVAVGAGTMDVSGKVEMGKTSARILSDIMFGATASIGSSYLEADGEAGMVPTASSYVVTVQNATNFLGDLGVVNVASGVPYGRVTAGAETAGLSYSLGSGANKGKYTFAAGDTGLAMSISYYYANTSSGETVPISNATQGLIGNFQAVHVLPWGLEQDMFVLNSCVASSSGFSTKNSGFGMTTMEYMASVDGSGNLGTATFAESS